MSEPAEHFQFESPRAVEVRTPTGWARAVSLGRLGHRVPVQWPNGDLTWVSPADIRERHSALAG